MTLTRQIAARSCICIAVIIAAIFWIIACLLTPEGKSDGR